MKWPEGIANNVSDHFRVIGVIYGHNGCCKEEPYILTINDVPVSKDRPEGLNYSCECNCGSWCTNGHKTIEGAIREYEDMTRRSEEEKAYSKR